MGVPRLFRYLAERYPLILRDLRPGDVAALAGLSIPASITAIQQLIESQQRGSGGGRRGAEGEAGAAGVGVARGGRRKREPRDL